MPAVQVHAAMGRARGHRHVHGRDDRVRACRGGFLGRVVRALSDDLARAGRPRQRSRGAFEGREGRRRLEPRTGYQVRRTVDPVACGDSGRQRSRPGCRRAASRRFGAAIGASARCVKSPSEVECAVVRPWPAVLKQSSAASTRRADPWQRKRPSSYESAGGGGRIRSPTTGRVGLERATVCRRSASPQFSVAMMDAIVSADQRWLANAATRGAHKGGESRLGGLDPTAARSRRKQQLAV